MRKKCRKFLLRITLTLFLIPFLVYAQSAKIKIEAGLFQFVNWQETKTIQLQGSIFPDKVTVQWSCPANSQVKFNDVSDPVTKVTFPRPGYYMLQLTAVHSDNNKIYDTVIINVFQPNSYKQRLNDLINLMTIEEKIGQLSNVTNPIPRLGIPRYNYWSEALHGILGGGTTSFPQVVALGATWDPDLVFQVASAISDEARVKHKIEGKGLSYWSPTLNIARDPRWGRNEESYSEDPYLLSRMGVAFVTGMQGDHPYYLKTIATPKHFIANNEERRRHTGSSDVDMRSLWEYYMPAFQQAISEAGAYSIMGAYNELNQVPCCGNQYLLTDVLRKKWGFEGYVVSDCGAIHDMVSGHHFFETGAQAAARGLLSGCDLNCGGYYRIYLPEALDQGLIEEKDIDRALTRVLSARFRLGDFDPPDMVPYHSIPDEELDSPEHRELALKAAHKAIVLLKNKGILPLDKNKIKSIAVIGPNAAECQLGIYSGWPNIQVSPFEGIKHKASQYGIKVHYTKGCDIGGGLLRPIPAHYFSLIEGTGQTGMRGEYFDNMDLKGEPVFTRIDSIIDFAWGVRSPGPGMPEDQFSVRWTGKIIPPVTRTYHLGTRTDDGSRLYVDGNLLFQDWTEHGEKPNSGEIKLRAGEEYEIVFEYFDNGMGATARLTWDLGQKEFNQAKRTAQDNDLVILVLGVSPGIASEELDRTTINLPQIQQQLIKEIYEVNSNIIIVLINGGPLALAGSEDYAAAIIEAWYTGQAAGTAIADVLFGDYNPGGKLPETFYVSAEQLPPFADYDIINNGRTYMYFEKPVSYPFGYGLSYTKFEFSNLILSSDKISQDKEITFQCTVQNIGNYQGDEVIQVYVSDKNASVKVPIRQLKRFQRLTLLPEEKKTVSFTLPVSELSFYDIESNEFIVEPGEFEIQIGSSSQDIRLRKSFFVE